MLLVNYSDWIVQDFHLISYYLLTSLWNKST